MKGLPQINHWVEEIDATTFAAFAERRWEHAPRYTVFLLVDRTATPWSDRRVAYEKLDAMLYEFERKLVGYLGSGFAKKWANEANAGTIISLRNGGLVSSIIFQS